MYRLILLFYVVRAFCKTSCALLFQDKTNRTIKKIKFFSAALRTGCFNRHQGLIGTYAAIDYRLFHSAGIEQYVACYCAYGTAV